MLGHSKAKVNKINCFSWSQGPVLMRAAVIVVAAVAAIGWSFGRLNVPAFVVASAWSCVLLALRVCVEVVCARRCVCVRYVWCSRLRPLSGLVILSGPRQLPCYCDCTCYYHSSSQTRAINLLLWSLQLCCLKTSGHQVPGHQVPCHGRT